jgi:hypothetical protein
MHARLALLAGSALGLALLVHCGGTKKKPDVPEGDAPAVRPAEEAGGGAGGAPAEPPPEKPRRPDPKLVQKALDRTGADAPDAAGSHGLRFEVVEAGPRTSWAFVVVNRGSEDAHVVFDPRLLTLEIEAPPDPSAKRRKPPKPRVCRLPPTLRPDTEDDSFVIKLAPGHGMVEVFDPQLYCLPEDGVSPLVSGAKVRASFGFPLKTKTVWKRGKREEEVLPQVAPFVATLFPEGAHRHGRRRGRHGDHEKGEFAADVDAGADAALEEEELEETDAGDGEEEAPRRARVEPTGSVKLLTGTPFELGSDYARPTKLEDERLALELVRGSDALTESNTAVTLKLVNRGKRPERVYFRREFVSFQVTGPDGPVICDPQPDTRAPDRQAFALLNPAGSLTVTSRMIELCPDDTFARPGLYVVEAEFDAFADGKEFGMNAFTGRLVAERGVVVRVQKGTLPFPGARVLERVRVGAPPTP